MGRDRTSHELGHQLQSIPDTLAASCATSQDGIGLLAKTIGFRDNPLQQAPYVRDLLL